jgi:hypothetical protein
VKHWANRENNWPEGQVLASRPENRVSGLLRLLEIEGIESAAREAGIRAIVPKAKAKAWNLIGSIENTVSRGSSPQAH